MDHDAGAAGRVGQLDWLLDDLVQRVGQVSKAVILSQDGIALGASGTLERDDAEHLAALAAGFQSLARGAGRHFGGPRRAAARASPSSPSKARTSV
jgi:predicted regulator of Ras-like GTPase activity (Roadblock/LC7/MglB family)